MPDRLTDAEYAEAREMDKNQFRIRLLYELEEIRDTVGTTVNRTFYVLTSINGLFATLVMGVLRGWF